MFVFPRPTLSLIALCTLIPVLAGCETVHDWVHDDSEITVKNAPKVEPVGLTPPSAGRAPLSDDELRSMTRKMSGGSVEIYDIGDGNDNGMISIAPVPSVSSIQTPAGMAYPSDPSVTVFPLDDFGGAYGGGMISPAVPYNAGPSSMTPAPFEGSDARGKLNSSAGKDVSRIYFDYGSDKIDAADKTVLAEAANAAKFAPIDRVRVEGHASVDAGNADPVSARMLNLKESMNRAYAVSRSLIQQGVPAEKIKTVAWGDTIPAGGNAAQRRVDIVTAPGY